MKTFSNSLLWTLLLVISGFHSIAQDTLEERIKKLEGNLENQKKNTVSQSEYNALREEFTKKLDKLKEELTQSILEKVAPIGSIIPFAGDLKNNNEISKKMGSGKWLLCDGKKLKKSDYPELFAQIGNSWGGASDSLELPNLQGRFLRGVGGDASVNPEAGLVVNNEGINGGVGALQEDAIGSFILTYALQYAYFYSKPLNEG